MNHFLIWYFFKCLFTTFIHLKSNSIFYPKVYIPCILFSLHNLNEWICPWRFNTTWSLSLFLTGSWVNFNFNTIFYNKFLLIYRIFCEVNMIKLPVGSLWSWSNGSWIYNYLCNQWRSPLTLWVQIPLRQGVLDTLCDKVCQWLVAGLWLSLGTPVSSNNKTDRRDLTEILLKVA